MIVNYCSKEIMFLIREHLEIQLIIKISEIRLPRFGIILPPLSRRNKDNDRVSNLIMG